MGKKIRKRGILPPYHPLQLFSWVVTLLNMISVGLLYVPNSKHIELVGLFYFFQTGVVLFALFITVTDPTDPVSIGKEGMADTSIIASCSICNTNVDPTSKHCGQCNRCVNGFDHHCKWLNTCIGKYNYRTFILLISTVFAEMIILALLAMWMLFYYIQEENILKISVSCLLLFEVLVILLGDSHLICLHFYLYRKGITTYEYILERKKAKARKISQDHPDKRVCQYETEHGKTIPGNITIDGPKLIDLMQI